MRQYLYSSVIALALATCSFGAFAKEAPTELNFCTGGEGGFYESLGTDIGKSIVKKQPDIKLNVVNTGGSVENASMLKAGDCDIAVIQADAATTLPLPADLKVVDAHTEVVYWIHKKGGEVDDFGDMEKDSLSAKYAVATVAGSGALVTVKNWVETDKDYAGARILEFDDWYAAAEAVAQGFTKKAGITIEVAGMLYIGRPGVITADILEDFGGQLEIGEVNDSSFASSKDLNGNPLYVSCSIPSDKTAGLKTSTMGSPDTYCLRAQVVYNNEYHAGLETKQARALRKSVDKGINSVVKAVR